MHWYRRLCLLSFPNILCCDKNLGFWRKIDIPKLKGIRAGYHGAIKLIKKTKQFGIRNASQSEIIEILKEKQDWLKKLDIVILQGLSEDMEKQTKVDESHEHIYVSFKAKDNEEFTNNTSNTQSVPTHLYNQAQ